MRLEAGRSSGGPRQQQQQPQRRQQPTRGVRGAQQRGRGSSRAPAPAQEDHHQPSSQQQEEWLAKALARAGVASRRDCIDLIRAGKVSVNDAVVADPATRVRAGADVLSVAGVGRVALAPAGGPAAGAGAAAGAPPGSVFVFAVHKPPGYICSNVSSRPGMRAVDLLQPWLDDWQRQHGKGALPPRFFTVGRLDVITSGLLFITNDGDWAQQVIHPSADLTKEYWATIEQAPSSQQLAQLRGGTVIEGVHVAPRHVAVLQQQQQQQQQRGSSSSSRCVVRLDVAEGKKHEVRLLIASAGLRLLQLKRVRVGGFVLPDRLGPGQYQQLTPGQQRAVLQPPPQSPRQGAGAGGGGGRGGRGGGGRGGRGRGGRTGRSSSGSGSRQPASQPGTTQPARGGGGRGEQPSRGRGARGGGRT